MFLLFYSSSVTSLNESLQLPQRCKENENCGHICSKRVQVWQNFWYILAIFSKVLLNLPWMLGFCYPMADMFCVSPPIKCIVS